MHWLGHFAPPVVDGSTPPPPLPDCAGKPGPAASRQITIRSGGRERQVELDVPPGYDPTAFTPLVIALHGFTRDVSDIRAISHLSDVGAARGFLVAYPQGVQNSWNAGACCGEATAFGGR